ncbi:MAG: DUF1987 domain-containing protein [Bacteroidales bacterium]|nr:DUF1987 domain-containing protein [Bacteroidales bacterium]
MESIKIERTRKTPDVVFNAETGKIQIEGKSIPENSIEFYKPLVDWLDEYGNNPVENTEVNIKLEYFNTSSSKCILDVFKKLETIYKGDNNVIINWYYEEDDEDMLEAGEDYQSILKIPFKMIEMEE